MLWETFGLYLLQNMTFIWKNALYLTINLQTFQGSRTWLSFAQRSLYNEILSLDALQENNNNNKVNKINLKKCKKKYKGRKKK